MTHLRAASTASTNAITGQRRRTAYHEAGHAVVTWALDRAFRFASIVPGEDFAGRVVHGAAKWFRPDMDKDGRTVRKLEDKIMISWGGAVAQDLLLGRKHPGRSICSSSCDHDRQWIAELARFACGAPEEVGPYTEWLRVRTLTILRNPTRWRAVEAVAAALLERGTLRWPTARDIMILASGPHPEIFYQRYSASIKRTLEDYGHLFEGLIEGLDEAAADRLDRAVAAISEDRPAVTTRSVGPGRVVPLPQP